MSEIVNYDVHSFYMANSRQNGYKRLSRKIKNPVVKDMQAYAHSLGMRFHVSDAHCRDCNDACNCCGVPPEWNVSQEGNIGQAIIIAREKGEVRWSDISESINSLFPFGWVDASAFNTGSNRKRAERYNMSMAEWLHNNWNNPANQLSPAKAYGGLLIADRVDENGDVVYKYKLGRE